MKLPSPPPPFLLRVLRMVVRAGAASTDHCVPVPGLDGELQSADATADAAAREAAAAIEGAMGGTGGRGSLDTGSFGAGLGGEGADGGQGGRTRRRVLLEEELDDGGDGENEEK